MSNLTYAEKMKIERLLCMGDGYVLNFSDRTFREFIHDSVERDIYDERYMHGSGSKANRLRGFWKTENNALIGKLLTDLIDYASGLESLDTTILPECRKIAMRLMQDSPVQEAAALTAPSDERNFEIIAKAIRDAIEKNELEGGLDRLHTYVVMFIRLLCEKNNITVTREKPLHSLFGEYIKSLKSAGYIHSQMTERILKGNISVLEAFNTVRNENSLAHDNPLLDYDEALLIFNHVASSIRFLRSLEDRLDRSNQRNITDVDDISF
jgi:hypothetical protein